MCGQVGSSVTSGSCVRCVRCILTVQTDPEHLHRSMRVVGDDSVLHTARTAVRANIAEDYGGRWERG